MNQPAAFTIKTHVNCPNCHEPGSSIDHLKPDSHAGPWYCKECGFGFKIDIAQDGVPTVTPIKDKSAPTVVLLKLTEKVGDREVYFVIYGTMHCENGVRPSLDELNGHHQFLYEEHTCPTNWMTGVEALVWGDNTDPHALIEHVQSVYLPTVSELKAMDLDPDDFGNNGDPFCNLSKDALIKLFPALRQAQGS
jgi:hypothetical protein